MTAPLTRAKVARNLAFLDALALSGNVRDAARTAGIDKSVLYRRRAAHPAFAQAWDAAQATAQARLHAEGGRSAAPPPTGGIPLRTRGGEPVVVRAAGGRLQVRRSHPDKLTRACEQAFLLALSATCNVALSAAAAVASGESFWRRRRENPGFAREWRLALQEGYERIEMALLEGFLPSAHKDDAWRHNEPPSIPPMTVNQALQLLYLHQKEARLLSEPAHVKRRRGESPEARSYRLAAMYEEGRRRAREAFAVAEAARRDRGEMCHADMLSTLLPDLAQVKGWSRADPAKVPHDADVALFGGRRIGDVAGEEE